MIKLENIRSGTQAQKVVKPVEELLLQKIPVKQLKLELWKENFAYYTGILEYNSIEVLLEINVETLDTNAYVDEKRGWIRLGNLDKLSKK